MKDTPFEKKGERVENTVYRTTDVGRYKVMEG
jgi:hypothetical protein